MPEFYAGYGERIITPEQGIDLAGYGYYLNRKSGTVLDNLKIRAAALTFGEKTSILVSCDLLGFTVQKSDEMRRRIADEFSLPQSHILLACTHTHTAPATLPLIGCGEENPDYVVFAEQQVYKAVCQAMDDRKPAKFSYGSVVIEPIGWNRRDNSFEHIDPVLGVLICTRKDRKIYLANYACHPVTLGPVSKVSADWPGAVVSKMEESGASCLVFQGFCGDINPVVFGSGTEEDISLYGILLTRKICLAEKDSMVFNQPSLYAVERRISLPLNVLSLASIEEELKKTGDKSVSCRRAMERWASLANKRRENLAAEPYLPDIPIQALAIGDMKIIGIPGEAFCEYGLKLREDCPNLFPVGYANGNVGYIPTADAYDREDGYETYIAPRLYRNTLFPFLPDTERIVLDTCRDILSKLY